MTFRPSLGDGEPARPQIISDGRSSLGFHCVLMSARACSLRNAPGLRYPDFRTLVVLCRMLGAEPLCSDMPQRGATRHPVREVCAADQEQPQLAAHLQLSAPRPATGRRPALVCDIRRTSARVRLLRSAHPPSARKSKTRAEPASTLPPWCPDLRIRPPRKLPTCHPRRCSTRADHTGLPQTGVGVERITFLVERFSPVDQRPRGSALSPTVSCAVPPTVCRSPRPVRHRCGYRCASR